MLPLAQAAPFTVEGGSSQAYMMAVVAIIAGFVLMFALMKLPSQYRRGVVTSFAFVAGAVYVLEWLWPKPIGYTPEQIPNGFIETTGVQIQDTVSMMGSILQVVQGILLFLGVYSVLRIHSKRFFQKTKDWPFSLALLLSMFTMIIVGYAEYNSVVRNPSLSDPQNWQFWQIFKDFLFDGMLQNMDAAMFSIIAFFILSAAYRAFRIRSVEATILLATALIVMLSLMGGVEYASSQVMSGLTGGDSTHFLNSFSLGSIRGWIRDVVQGPAIRALEWGILIGALSMGMRLWLSLERGGSS